MRDPSGISKGSGFVAFTSHEEASRAVSWDVYVLFLLFMLKNLSY